MAEIKGDRSVEIDAPIERCFEIAADIENAPDWQGSLRDVEVLERDSDGRPELVDTRSDAKVKTVSSRLRFSYDPPTGITWVQEKGDTSTPVMPQHAAGMRMEPPVSSPKEVAQRQAAVAAPEPLLEVPGFRSRSQGL